MGIEIKKIEKEREDLQDARGRRKREISGNRTSMEVFEGHCVSTNLLLRHSFFSAPPTYPPNKKQETKIIPQIVALLLLLVQESFENVNRREKRMGEERKEKRVECYKGGIANREGRKEWVGVRLDYNMSVMSHGA